MQSLTDFQALPNKSERLILEKFGIYIDPQTGERTVHVIERGMSIGVAETIPVTVVHANAGVGIKIWPTSVVRIETLMGSADIPYVMWCRIQGTFRGRECEVASLLPRGRDGQHLNLHFQK